MQFQKLAKIFLLSAAICSTSFAKDSNTTNSINETILSQDRLDILDLSKKQNIENNSKMIKDEITPDISLNYQKNFTDTYDNTQSGITINQPLFKSGGIYSAIKYANIDFKYKNLDIESQKKELIRQVTTLLFNLHIIDLNIKKSKLQLNNAKIDIQRKKEQVLNGFLDTSYLDRAILDANGVKNSLADLYFQKKELENSFNNLASKKYTEFNLPTLSLVNKDSFLEKSLELAKAKASIKKEDYSLAETKSRYLPNFSASMNYSHSHDTDETTTNYTIQASMPIDFSSLNDIETQRLEHLISKLKLNNTIKEEENFYKTKLSRINMYENKIQIAKEDYELYDSLLKIIVEEKNAQLKTQSDVDTLANSQKIKSLEVQILELQKQIELLEIYSKTI